MSSSSDALVRKRRRVGPSLGIVFSLFAHLLVLVALVLGVRQSFSVEPTRSSDVELIRAWPSDIRRRPQVKRQPPPSETLDTTSPSRQTQLKTGPTNSGAPSPLPPPTSPLPAPVPAQTPAPAMRLGVGCAHPDFMRLTPEERAACRDRFAARGPSDRDYAEAGIDPKARAAFDARSKAETFLRSPFLSAMPKKGCRPRVTEHDAAAFGKSQPDLTVEATCVVHF